MKSCVDLFTAEATKHNLDFTLYKAIDESPDIVFILDNYFQAYEQAVATYAIPVFVQHADEVVPNMEHVKVLKVSSLKQVVKKSIQMMKNFYYTGDRPRLPRVVRIFTQSVYFNGQSKRI